jgi:phage anti-repressor protein
MNYNQITVTKTTIGKIHAQAVNARDLHRGLGVRKHFADWIKVQLARGFFVENVDYLVFHQKGENLSGGRPTQEYVLTIEAAKNIGMMSATQKGKEIRDYFIQCEKIAVGQNAHLESIRQFLLLDAPSEWVKLYPDSYYIALMRLYNQEFDKTKNKPLYCANITRRWVYDVVLPAQLQIEIDSERGLERKHQWFTKENGRNYLLAQISKVEMVAKMSQSRADFESNCARLFLSSPLQLAVSI